MADSVPPPYDEATKDSHLVPSQGGEREAPPTYDQLFGVSELRDAKRESSNHATFAVKFCQVISGTVACAVCMMILAALPIAMIVIGSVYLDDCPGRKNIPVWMIVFGCVSLVQSIIDIMKRCFGKKKRNDEEEGSVNNRRNYANNSGNCLESFISFFLFVWIIVGSGWVFGYFDDFQDCRHDDMVDCCHPVPFLFSFVTLIVIYSVTFLVFCCCCFAFCCAAFCGASAVSGD